MVAILKFRWWQLVSGMNTIHAILSAVNDMWRNTNEIWNFETGDYHLFT